MFFINWPRSNLRRAAIRAPAPRQRACSMTSLRERSRRRVFAGSLNCTTSITGDQIGLLSGYQAGAGYDLATGLGSVNASNLVNNWNSAGRALSTTSLTLNGGNPVKIAHGTPVSVAVSVSPNSPQPSGYASLAATQGAGNTGFDLLTVDNGTASGTTNMLPGGTLYSVQAHYAGDANYAPSDSSPVTVSVSPEASQTDVHVAIVDALTGQVTNSNAISIQYGSLSVCAGGTSPIVPVRFVSAQLANLCSMHVQPVRFPHISTAVP